MKLEEYKKYFSVAFDEFTWLNEISADQIHEDVRYEKITDVTRVDRDENESFFFKGGKLKLIYISNEALINRLWNEFKLTSTAPAETVRSRAGKTSNQLIFAAHGITVSITKDEVHFIEIYLPCTVDDYLENVYREPGKFIR
jgi:hypothetical protein